MANAQYSHTPTHWQPELTEIVDGRPVRFCDVCVHEFGMSDVEDPDIYVAGPIWEWQHSESGQWVAAHAVEQPYWIRNVDYNTYGYQYRVIARLSEQDQTFFKLKWGTS